MIKIRERDEVTRSRERGGVVMCCRMRDRKKIASDKRGM